jgi:hypothetical protein
MSLHLQKVALNTKKSINQSTRTPYPDSEQASLCSSPLDAACLVEKQEIPLFGLTRPTLQSMVHRHSNQLSCRSTIDWSVYGSLIGVSVDH